MTPLEMLFSGLLLGSLVLALAGILGMPLLLRVLTPRYPGPEGTPGPPPSSFSLIVPAHGSAAPLGAKFASLERLRWPHGPMELILTLDGEVTDWPPLPESREGLDVRVLRNPRQGKHGALNAAAEVARGEILICSDMDARLSPGAVEAMAEVFRDPTVGAACGRVVVEGEDRLMQRRYLEHEAKVLAREQALLGSITASNGTLLAIRRRLFEPVPPGVVDDLFIGLTAVKAGHRFVFVPGAVALIDPPSKTPGRVMRRQRRIVCRGLTALRMRPSVLSLRRHGRYAVALILHKAVRRAVPLAAAFAYLLLAALSLASPARRWVLPFAILTVALLVAMLVTVAVGLDGERRTLPRPFGVIAWAFCVNLGIGLGSFDFLSGRKVTRW